MSSANTRDQSQERATLDDQPKVRLMVSEWDLEQTKRRRDVMSLGKGPNRKTVGRLTWKQGDGRCA